jgi:hypothetical protein
MRTAIVFLALLLAGCATDQPGKIEIRTVNVPVPIHCKPNLSKEPDYPDTDQALRNAPNIFERVKLLLAGRKIRTARTNELETAITGCE